MVAQAEESTVEGQTLRRQAAISQVTRITLTTAQNRRSFTPTFLPTHGLRICDDLRGIIETEIPDDYLSRRPISYSS